MFFSSTGETEHRLLRMADGETPTTPLQSETADKPADDPKKTETITQDTDAARAKETKINNIAVILKPGQRVMLDTSGVKDVEVAQKRGQVEVIAKTVNADAKAAREAALKSLPPTAADVARARALAEDKVKPQGLKAAQESARRIADRRQNVQPAGSPEQKGGNGNPEAQKPVAEGQEQPPKTERERISRDLDKAMDKMKNAKNPTERFLAVFEGIALMVEYFKKAFSGGLNKPPESTAAPLTAKDKETKAKEETAKQERRKNITERVKKEQEKTGENSVANALKNLVNEDNEKNKTVISDAKSYVLAKDSLLKQNITLTSKKNDLELQRNAPGSISDAQRQLFQSQIQNFNDTIEKNLKQIDTYRKQVKTLTDDAERRVRDMKEMSDMAKDIGDATTKAGSMSDEIGKILGKEGRNDPPSFKVDLDAEGAVTVKFDRVPPEMQAKLQEFIGKTGQQINLTAQDLQQIDVKLHGPKSSKETATPDVEKLKNKAQEVVNRFNAESTVGIITLEPGVRWSGNGGPDVSAPGMVKLTMRYAKPLTQKESSSLYDTACAAIKFDSGGNGSNYGFSINAMAPDQVPALFNAIHDWEGASKEERQSKDELRDIVISPRNNILAEYRKITDHDQQEYFKERMLNTPLQLQETIAKFISALPPDIAGLLYRGQTPKGEQLEKMKQSLKQLSPQEQLRQSVQSKSPEDKAFMESLLH